MHRWLAVVVVLVSGPAFAEPTGTAVEWFNTITGHYFFTSGLANSSTTWGGSSLMRLMKAATVHNL